MITLSNIEEQTYILGHGRGQVFAVQHNALRMSPEIVKNMLRTMSCAILLTYIRQACWIKPAEV